MKMNETLIVIKNRRSIRKYKAKQIGDAELKAIIEAALYAPNAMNQQRWHFTVVQNKAMLDRFVSIIKENIQNSGIEFLIERVKAPDYHTFHHAPTVVLVSGDGKAKFMEISCGAAAQNIALAAASLNIGSCVMTSPEFLFASDKGNALKKELGIPDGYNFICSIALGYNDGDIPVTPPRDKKVINYIK
jgi:nitroreductase